MIVLSETPALMDEFFPDKPSTCVEEFDPSVLSLWTGAGGVGKPLARKISDPGIGDWNYVVLINHATDSQFAGLQVLLRSGGSLPDRAVCLAMSGEKFRGQRGRPWMACEGNMHLTAVFRPEVEAKALGAALSALPAVVSCETIRSFIAEPGRASIKWVNDVLLGSSKCSGVLTATRMKNSRVEYVLWGIGVNILVKPEVPSTVFVPSVACVKDVCPNVNRAAFTREALRQLAQHHDQLMTAGPRPILEAYRARSCVVGKGVRIWPDDCEGLVENIGNVPPLASGRVLSINDDLSLNLDSMSAPVTRGRLELEKACKDP